MKKKVTMKDIAEKLDVAVVTVSRALNNKEDISEELKELILKEAKKMGYRHNSNVKTNRLNQSYSIGILSTQRFFQDDTSYYATVLSHLSNIIDEYGYTGKFHILSIEDEKELKLPRMYIEQKIDGLLVLGELERNYLNEIVNIDIPIVFLDFYHFDYDVDSIIIDNIYVVNKLVNELIRLNHKRIGFVGSLNRTSSVKDRFLGYVKALVENGINVDHGLIIEDCDADMGEITSFNLPQDMPTAFVCNNDKVAYYLIKQLEDNGYKVPEDISVVGFDNTSYSQLSNPKITTVKINIIEMVRTSIKIIAKKINNPKRRYGRIFVEGTIIHQDSVKIHKSK